MKNHGGVSLERYYYSGSLTTDMYNYLINMPDFEPLNILVSQLDRSSITKNIEWRTNNIPGRDYPFCKNLFIDSGAYSVHTGKAKITADEYIEYINSIDDSIDVFAQLDKIPGEFRMPKSKEDYEESARLSWENYLYMRERVKSPHKLMPVFHFGEDMEHLKSMLEWRDENGEALNWVGISPANDASQQDKNIYLQNVADTIAASSNPNVKTHLYGMTSLDALAKYPCYSADSISHRLIAGYCKVMSEHFGVISVSKRHRTSSVKSNMSFLETADEYNMEVFRKEVESCNLTIDQIAEESSARVVFTMHTMQKLLKTKYKYKPTNVKKTRKFF